MHAKVNSMVCNFSVFELEMVKDKDSMISVALGMMSDCLPKIQSEKLEEHYGIQCKFQYFQELGPKRGAEEDIGAKIVSKKV